MSYYKLGSSEAAVKDMVSSLLLSPRFAHQFVIRRYEISASVKFTQTSFHFLLLLLFFFFLFLFLQLIYFHGFRQRWFLGNIQFSLLIFAPFFPFFHTIELIQHILTFMQNNSQRLPNDKLYKRISTILKSISSNYFYRSNLGLSIFIFRRMPSW